MSEARVGDHVIRWSERGAGDRVVLVHSSGLSSRQWRRIGEALEPRWTVTLPDLLGYGESSAWPESERFHFTMDLLALEAMLDVLAPPGAPPVHLVGHSYGGFLALLATLHRPRAVRSLALYEPVAFGVLRSVGDAEAIATLLPSDEPWPEGAEAIERWMERFVDYWNGAGGWRGLAPSMREQFLRAGPKLVGEVRSLGLDGTPHHAMATITAPTLILGGERAPLAPERVLALLERTIPGARRERIAGAGHMGPLTHAAEVAALLHAHFARA
jgi:pimeloyl-ACP methyl ester carboxylesterase